MVLFFGISKKGFARGAVAGFLSFGLWPCIRELPDPRRAPIRAIRLV
jgi:hypothetical protein